MNIDELNKKLDKMLYDITDDVYGKVWEQRHTDCIYCDLFSKDDNTKVGTLLLNAPTIKENRWTAHAICYHSDITSFGDNLYVLNDVIDKLKQTYNAEIPQIPQEYIENLNDILKHSV